MLERDGRWNLAPEGELFCDGGLWVRIYRNGTVVWSGGNGTTRGDFKAVWSTGATGEITADCG